MSKLKEALLIELEITDRDRRQAAMSANSFVQELENALAINQKTRKQFGPLLGRELRMAEKDLKKIINFMKEVIGQQKAKGGTPRTKL